MTGEMTASQAATRAAILHASSAILAEEGVSGLSVSGIMRRAGISRTAFYRLFDDVYEVVGAVLEGLSTELLAASGDWLAGKTGSPEVIHGNLFSFAEAFEAHGRTLDAIRAAASLDDRVETIWAGLVQAFRDATEAAIRRDQEAGVIDRDLDPVAAAMALNWMGEQAAVDLLGRRGEGGAAAYADLLTPVWSRTLFGLGAEGAKNS